MYSFDRGLGSRKVSGLIGDPYPTPNTQLHISYNIVNSTYSSPIQIVDPLVRKRVTEAQASSLLDTQKHASHNKHLFASIELLVESVRSSFLFASSQYVFVCPHPVP